jgi:hypothetical protein
VKEIGIGSTIDILSLDKQAIPADYPGAGAAHGAARPIRAICNLSIED